MMARRWSAKHWMLLAAALGTLFLFLEGQLNSRAQVIPASTKPLTTIPSTAPAPAFAAMAYYQQNCARCHGPQGTFYGPTLGQKLDDGQLQKVVDQMATGPGNAPLASDELAAETAFHRALIMRTPFLSVTQMNDDGSWAGEAMPDAKVTLVIGKQQIVATLDDSDWTAQLPAGTKSADVTITAQRNGITTTLRPNVASYSNTAPLPPPSARPK